MKMNNLLKSSEIYDLTTWKKVEYLGSIRNLCSHKKEREPKKEEVEELIAGVNKVIKETYWLGERLLLKGTIHKYGAD